MSPPASSITRRAAQVITTLMKWAETTECAMVVATHDAEVAEAFDQVWHMEHGHLSTANGDSIQ